MKKFIYKICNNLEWANAKKGKRFNGTKKDRLDWFIHFSFKQQVKSTLNKYFLKKDKLILLKIDTSKLNNIIIERSSDDLLFPHLYSYLDLKHVKKVYKIFLNKKGEHNLKLKF